MTAQYRLRPVSHPTASATGRSIGELLIDSGLLTAEDAGRIVKRQKEEKLRFGETAIRLGLLRESELRYALACQFNYAYLLPAERQFISEELVAACEPFGDESEQFRSIRSQLLLRRRNGLGRQSGLLAIVGSAHREGRSYLAANLAIVFAQLGERTLLIDADLRHPRQHCLFGLENKHGLSSLLAGRPGCGAVAPIQSLWNLEVLPAGPIPPNPLELLSQSGFAELLAELAAGYDNVLIDTSAFGDSTDANMVASCAGSALVVARNNHSRVGAFGSMIELLKRSGVVVSGAVFNAPALLA